MIVLAEFANWFTSRQTQLNCTQCKVGLTWSSETVDRRSVRADIDTDQAMARATVWETGECMKQAIDLKSGDQFVNGYTICNTPEELHAFLETFMGQISCLGAIADPTR